MVVSPELEARVAESEGGQNSAYRLTATLFITISAMSYRLVLSVALVAAVVATTLTAQGPDSGARRP